MNLAGKVALVTGSSRGIGRATVLGLAELGADVAVHYKSSRGKGEQVSQEVTALGRRSVVVGGDVSQRDVVKAMLARIENELGSIDILVNNASTVIPETPVWEITEGQWDRVFAVNVKGTLFASQAVMPSMQARSSGIILNMCTLSADLALGGNAASVSTNGAISSMTSALALELAPWDIRVNSLVADHVDTPDNLREILKNDALREKYLNCVATKRLESFDKIVKTAMYLVSDNSSHITGQQIGVEDGMKMWQRETD